MKTESMEIITGIKNMLATLFSITLAYFAPVKDMVFVIFFIFAINCLAGLIAGIVAKRAFQQPEVLSLPAGDVCVLRNRAEHLHYRREDEEPGRGIAVHYRHRVCRVLLLRGEHTAKHAQAVPSLQAAELHVLCV